MTGEEFSSIQSAEMRGARRESLRVAFVLPGDGASGGVRVTARFAGGLRQRGHQVTIFFRSTPYRIRDLARNSFVRIMYGASCDWLRAFDGAKRPYRSLTAADVGRNDFVLAVGPVAARAVASLPDWCGGKIEHVHGVGQDWATILEAWRRPWPKIVVASFLKREIESRGLGPVIDVIPNGIDTSEYFPDPTAGPRVGVGTVWHRGGPKDPETSLRVMSMLRAQHPQIPLYVFGSARRSAGFPSGVHYVRFPAVPIARALYSRCKIWYCASRSEGFGLPVLEAMACGCAVVSTDCGGPRDIITDGVDGFLVPVSDADAIVRQVHTLLNDDHLCGQVAQRAVHRCGDFRWSEVVGRLETALHRAERDAH